MKATKTMLNIKIEKSVKDEAQQTARLLGLPLSAVISEYLKEFSADQRVTFTTHPMPNTRTQKVLRQAREDYKKGKNIDGPFKTPEDVLAYLRA
jgi:antitoxin component of RelBE/YafQ-DinJ toxin-antitoxin module